MKRKVLITGGATCEDIDPIRFITNRSTGKMGVALAKAAVNLGLTPTLILGENAVAAPKNVRTLRVRCAATMLAAVQAEFTTHDWLIMSAAVADYTPRFPLRDKLKKQNGDLTLVLKRTPDILRCLAAQRERAQKLLCGFSLETTLNLDEGRRKRREKKLDLLVVNDVSALGSTHDTAILLTAFAEKKLPPSTKYQLAKTILQMLTQLEAKKNKE